MSDWAKRLFEKVKILKETGVYSDDVFDKIVKEEMKMANQGSGMFQPGEFKYFQPPNPPNDAPATLPASINPAELVLRLLGGVEASKTFIVHAHQEKWGSFHPDILHISILNAHTKMIVRFEEDPTTFPSHLLIDKLRLLGNG